jgi:hypothetical protein
MGLVLALGTGGQVSRAEEGAGEEVYVSKGLNSKQDWGTFTLYPGDGGRALYLLAGNSSEVRLRFIGIFQSSDDPWVRYWVFGEEGLIPGTTNRHRQWAFQIDYPTLNGFVIYHKDDGSDPFLAKGWVVYDFAR